MRMTTPLNIISCLAWISSHWNYPNCNHQGEARERDCAAAVMWKSTELMYDPI
jgi:hypothetical protein